MKRQRGIALLTVLVAVALAASLAAAITWNLTLDEHRSASIIQGDQAYEYALGAEAWAEQILYRDRQNSPTATTLAQNWAQQLPPLPVEGGQILGHIDDLQGRFNLNNLVSQAGQADPIYVQQFQRLLTALNLDPALAGAVVDWMDADDVPTQPGGAEVDFYSRLTPPYRPPNAPMTSVSELQAVNGVTPQVYAALLPYVCVLPPGLPGAGGGSTATPLNVNTASAPLLMSLAPNLTQDQANQIVGARGTNGLTSVDQIKQYVTLPKNGPVPSVDSQYFLLTVTVEIGTTHVTLYSLLYRATGGGKTVALRRSLGTL